MIKQTVKFKNIDGVEVSKDLYFNLTTTEVSEQELLSDGQFLKDIEAVQGSDKMSIVYPLVQRMIGLAYGIRSEDGDFYKSDVDWERFKTTLAYNKLMEDLLFEDPVNNGQRLADFINGMLPEKIAKQAREQQAQAGFRPEADTSRPTPPPEAPINLGEVPNVPDTQVAAPVAQNVQAVPAPPTAEEPVSAWTNPPVQPVQEAPITQTSAPRDDLMGS
jgi:hypothetical protein